MTLCIDCGSGFTSLSTRREIFALTDADTNKAFPCFSREEVALSDEYNLATEHRYISLHLHQVDRYRIPGLPVISTPLRVVLSVKLPLDCCPDDGALSGSYLVDRHILCGGSVGPLAFWAAAHCWNIRVYTRRPGSFERRLFRLDGLKLAGFTVRTKRGLQDYQGWVRGSRRGAIPGSDLRSLHGLSRCSPSGRRLRAV